MNKSDIDFLTNVITLEKDKAIEESQKELGYMNGFSNGVNYLYKKNYYNIRKNKNGRGGSRK